MYELILKIRWLSMVFVSVFLSTLLLSSSLIAKDMDLQGHRGARGLRTENSIPAFIYALEHKMTTLELDTNVTKDKQLIVFHDSIINEKESRCLDRHGELLEPTPVSALTVAELKALDCSSLINEKFPEQKIKPETELLTLKEFFAFVKRYENEHSNAAPIRFNIENKFPESYSHQDLLIATKLMVEAIEAADVVERATVQSFAIEALPEIAKRNAAMKVSALFKPSYFNGFLMLIGFDRDRFDIIDQSEKVGAQIISPYQLYVTPKFIEYAHQKNIKVLPWTVNEQDKMLALMKMGVDGIISDYPNRLSDAYLLFIKN